MQCFSAVLSLSPNSHFCDVANKVAIQLDAELGIFMKGGRIGWQEFSDFVSICLCVLPIPNL